MTWTKNNITWPRDLLVKDLKKARVFNFGHKAHSDVIEVAQSSLENDAQTLCFQLAAERSSDGTVSASKQPRVKQMLRYLGGAPFDHRVTQSRRASTCPSYCAWW